MQNLTHIQEFLQRNRVIECLMVTSNNPEKYHFQDQVGVEKINLANLETFDSSIRAGEDLLVMQGEECVGTARATAPAWEWKGTPGRLAKMHQRL